MFFDLLHGWKLQSTSACNRWFRRPRDQIDVIAMLRVILKAAQVGSFDWVGRAAQFRASVGRRREINQLHQFAAVSSAGPPVTTHPYIKVDDDRT
jgi:hypothetical protein